MVIILQIFGSDLDISFTDWPSICFCKPIFCWFEPDFTHALSKGRQMVARWSFVEFSFLANHAVWLAQTYFIYLYKWRQFLLTWNEKSKMFFSKTNCIAQSCELLCKQNVKLVILLYEDSIISDTVRVKDDLIANI